MALQAKKNYRWIIVWFCLTQRMAENATGMESRLERQGTCPGCLQQKEKKCLKEIEMTGTGQIPCCAHKDPIWNYWKRRFLFPFHSIFDKHDQGTSIEWNVRLGSFLSNHGSFWLPGSISTAVRVLPLVQVCNVSRTPTFRPWEVQAMEW